MQKKDRNHQIWGVWARTLHGWGITDIVAALLEAAGPMSVIGAQAIYIAQPALGTFLPSQHLTAAAELLEDPQEVHSFAAFLRDAK